MITPLDEVEAVLAFDEEWAAWLDTDLGGDGPFARAVAGAVRLGLWNPVTSLRPIASSFHENRDLIEGVSFAVAGEVPRIAARRVVDAIPELHTLLDHAPDGDDRLEPHVRSVLAFAEELQAESPDSDGATPMLAERPRLKTTSGRKDAWGFDEDGVSIVQRTRDLLADLEATADAEINGLRVRVLGGMLDETARFVLDYAVRRQADGEAEFHDMLVWARDLLRDDLSALAHFRGRYSRVLIDEFQDTDPLQTELALLLAGSDGAGGAPRAGALFLVGDPKQSIYRFRRADIATMAGIVSSVSGGPVHLVHNFRAHKRLVAWCNHVFSSWMAAGAPHQADYVDLETDIEAPQTDPPMGAHFIGGPRDFSNIDAVRREEAQDIARVAREVCAGAWQVRDGDGREKKRPSRPGDLCVLFPRRTSLPYLEEALEESGVPFSLEGHSLVFLTQDVRDLVNCLRAIDDPSDQVSLVAALRSPAFACSDVDLWRWAAGGGGFNYMARHDGGGPVSRAFDALRTYHELRMQAPATVLIERFVRDRRLRELVCSGGRRRERWRRIELVIERARALAEAGRPSLREFLNWAQERADERVRMPEGGGAAGTDAVQLMTVHQAKGLEFPIVLLCGLNGRPPRSGAPVLFGSSPGDVGVRLGGSTSGFETARYEPLADDEKEADRQEAIRLMYVACTRACDHLIVSMYDQEGTKGERLVADLAEHAAGAGDLWREAEPLTYTERAPDRPAVEPFGDPASRRRWIADRDAALTRAKHPGSVSASSLETTAERAAGSAKDEREERETEPWRRGRAATAIGSAVHAVLQEADLETGSDLADIARRCALAEEMGQHTDEVRELAEATLESPVVRRAASAPWKDREVYVSADLDGVGVLDGIIDLIFEDCSGALVVVDFKTDRVPETGSLEAAATPYVPQLGAYAEAVRRATGRDVSEAWLVFSRRARAGLDAEYRIPDVADAAAKARARALEELRLA